MGLSLTRLARWKILIRAPEVRELLPPELEDLILYLVNQLEIAHLHGEIAHEPEAKYLSTAALLAAKYDLDFYDALSVAVAAGTSKPLVLDNDPLYAKLADIAKVHPTLRVISLSDYVQPPMGRS